MASAQISPSDTSISSQKIVKQCEDGVEFMELVAELLLLRSGSKAKALYPITGSGDSYSKSRDAIVATTKALAISIKDLTRQLKEEELDTIDSVIEQVSEKVTVLTESASQAAYITAMHDRSSVSARDGVIDQYLFAKARYVINTACDSFAVEQGTLSNQTILKLTQTIANNLSMLKDGCQKASQNTTIPEMDRAHFNACVQSLNGSSALLVACVKSYLTSGKAEDRRNMPMFAMPLKAAVNSIVQYCSDARFSSVPAELTPKSEQSQTEILAGAMSVVSAAVQMLNTVTNLMDDKTSTNKSLNALEKKALEDRHWQKLVSCARAVADSCKMLAVSIREHTPQSTPVSRRANPNGHSKH